MTPTNSLTLAEIITKINQDKTKPDETIGNYMDRLSIPRTTENVRKVILALQGYEAERP